MHLTIKINVLIKIVRNFKNLNSKHYLLKIMNENNYSKIKLNLTKKQIDIF